MRFTTLALLFSFLTLTIVGCATNPKHSFNVNYGDRKDLAFTGKGAAAGIMLDAVMGGAGIAIGIAIDEGIAKDIAKNINQPSAFNIIDRLNSKLQAAAKTTHTAKAKAHTGITQVTLNNYGFRTSPGGDDLTSAWLNIEFAEGDKKINIHYPEDFQNISTAKLTEVKTNPEIARNVLDTALDKVIAKWNTAL